MIESSFLYSSSWDSDLFQDFDPDLESSISGFENYVHNFERESSMVSSCSTTPNDLSSNSSDYEGLVLDDIDNLLPISDMFVSQILGENSATDFDFDSLSDSLKKCGSSEDHKTSPVRNLPKKTKKSLEYLSSTKLWSRMSTEEQLQTLHSLSDIVTCHMGIREQMEVIKIIDPSAVIAPDDKEFALDSSYLNDVKLKRIREFIKKQFHVTNTKSKDSSSRNSTSDKASSSTKMLSRRATSTSNSRTKRRQKKQKAPYFDEEALLKRKLELHGQKEAQSGLFVYEKVIKKLSNPMEEDEDVNILE